MSELRDAALDLARRGRRVLALEPRGKRPLRPPGATKRLSRHDATNEIEIIERWWRAEPNANIGIDCITSGLVALDVDDKPGVDGPEDLRDLERHSKRLSRFSSKAPTPTARRLRGLPPSR